MANCILTRSDYRKIDFSSPVIEKKIGDYAGAAASEFYLAYTAPTDCFVEVVLQTGLDYAQSRNANMLTVDNTPLYNAYHWEANLPWLTTGRVSFLISKGSVLKVGKSGGGYSWTEMYVRVFAIK